MSSHDDSFAASGSSPTEVDSPAPPDFLLENHFSIFLIRPLTEPAHAWLENNIDAAGGFQPYWPTIVVEHRYTADIVEGIRSDGLVQTNVYGELRAYKLFLDISGIFSDIKRSNAASCSAVSRKP